MLIRSRTLTGLLFITLAGTSAAGAAPLASSTHQTEQDKARRGGAGAAATGFSVFTTARGAAGIPFPEETHCKLINRVDIDSDNRGAHPEITGENRTAGAGTLSG